MHVEYLYDGSADQAVKAADLVNWRLPGEYPMIRFLARDGLDKNETWDNFAKGLIKWSGKDAPAFVSEELPRGMNIKEVLWFTAGHKGFASAAMAQEKFDVVVMNRPEPIVAWQRNGQPMKLMDQGGDRPVRIIPKGEPGRMFVRNLAKLTFHF